MHVEMVILVEEIFDVVGRKMKIHAAKVGIDGLVRRVKEVEDLV